MADKEDSTKNKKSRIEFESRFTTRNRFECLTEEDESSGSMDWQNETEIIDKENKTRKKKEYKPPPIVIHAQTTKHSTLINLIKSITQGKFHIKHNTNTITLFFENKNDWSIVKSSFTEKRIEFHTYTEKDNKTHAFVLKGLHSEIEAENVENELKESHEMQCKVYKMKTNEKLIQTENSASKEPQEIEDKLPQMRPLFLVVTSSEITLKYLQNKIRYILYTKIYWERHQNKRKAVQCRRCQRWGHATSNCNGKIRCLKCGQEHWTNLCTKPREEPAVCANCSGNHPANYTQCPSYLVNLNNRKQLSSTQNKTTKPQFREVDFPQLKIRPNTARKNLWHQNTQNDHQESSTSKETPKISTPTRKVNTNITEKQDDYTTFTELITEVSLLNQQINLVAVLSAIRDLNRLLSSAKDKSSKFQLTLQFFNNINNYDI